MWLEFLFMQLIQTTMQDYWQIHLEPQTILLSLSV